jgi:hypothetical protein
MMVRLQRRKADPTLKPLPINGEGKRERSWVHSRGAVFSPSSLAIRGVLRRGAILFLALCLGACARLLAFAPTGGHDVNSFVGVRFGRTLQQVEIAHPLGSRETSPYGADAYTLTNVEAGGVKYESVTYEFTADRGMQIVLARSAPGYEDPIVQQLRKTLGPPDKSDGNGAVQNPVTWNTASGARVSFDRSARRLILIGPYGKSLESDIGLREQAEEE